jgi:hypothetical protein
MSSKRWPPATRSAGWPAMARRRDPPGGGTYTKVERCGACTGAEKGARKARACLYRLGRRRGSGVRANWPSMAMAAGPALKAFNGAARLGETEWGIDGEGKTGALVLLYGGLKEGRGGERGGNGRRRRWMRSRGGAGGGRRA